MSDETPYRTAILRVLRKPPVGVGIVCIIVGAIGGHWSVLGLFWISYVVGYLTGRRNP
jgi:hypothetical protein